MTFTPEDIQARLRGRPFAPFRNVTTMDQTFDIDHPELVMVARTFLMVGTPSSDNPACADHVTRVALVHVAELRDLPAAASAANGQQV